MFWWAGLTNTFPSWFEYGKYCIRTLENITNVLVLWLILRINYNKYICLCRWCHQCIGSCCFKNLYSVIMIDNPYFELQDNNRTIRPTNPVLNDKVVSKQAEMTLPNTKCIRGNILGNILAVMLVIDWRCIILLWNLDFVDI